MAAALVLTETSRRTAFPITFRGFDPAEVRAYLAEVHASLDDAERRWASPRAAELLGDEVAHVLATARDAAARIEARAAEEARTRRAEVAAEVAALRAGVLEELAERRAEAEAELARLEAHRAEIVEAIDRARSVMAPAAEDVPEPAPEIDPPEMDPDPVRTPDTEPPPEVDPTPSIGPGPDPEITAEGREGAPLDALEGASVGTFKAGPGEEREGGPLDALEPGSAPELGPLDALEGAVAATFAGEPAGRPVDDLFARMRAEREAAVADARAVLARDDAPEDPQPGRRAARPDSLETALARAWKRALADEQNAVLDELRRGALGEAVTLESLVGDVDAHAARYRTAAAAALGGAAGEELDAFVDAELVTPLRARLVRALQAAGGDRDDAGARLRAAYREWKVARLGPIATDLVRIIEGRGTALTDRAS